MSINTELLNYIHQNAQMGKSTISRLAEMTDDIDFRKTLENQIVEYQDIYNQAEEKLKKENKEPKGLDPSRKIESYMMLKLSTLADKSTSHLAEMMIQGSNMGIIDITKNLKKYNEADKDILELGTRLLRTEQNNINEMKKFL